MKHILPTLALSATIFGAGFINPVDATPWQVWKTNSQCLNVETCTVVLAVVPTGKRLEVQNVSCFYEAFGVSNIRSATIILRNTSGALVLRDILVPMPLEQGYYAANHETKIFAKAGYRLSAQLIVAPAVTEQLLIECKLAGELLPA